MFYLILTLGSSSPCEETPVVQLDMSKIPPHLKIPFEQLQLLRHLGHVRYLCNYFIYHFGKQYGLKADPESLATCHI